MQNDKCKMLRVMTFNIWVGGEAGGQPLDQSVKVIQAARADIVGIQECCGKERNGKRPDNTRQIAEMLGWHSLSQDNDTASILSRHPIVGSTPGKWGAEIELPSGRRVWLFNAHFFHAPYQPYQLLGIPYFDGPFIQTADEAISQAQQARKHQVDAMLAEVAAVRNPDTVVFVTGDFNEPSSLDWTAAVHSAGRHPAVVRWPTTAAAYDAGFKDAYREVYPDPLTSPGFTWTPTTFEDDPKDHHDRIDFVMVGGPANVSKVEIVGERADKADIVVTPYPSDHHSVVATVTLE
jgi:endonuclease/exonuclease/phosphatase family metal-dependent hydrolase